MGYEAEYVRVSDCDWVIIVAHPNELDTRYAKAPTYRPPSPLTYVLSHQATLWPCNQRSELILKHDMRENVRLRYPRPSR